MDDKITILIPCLNEEAGIVKVITSFKEMGVTDIMVANGPSTDRTAEVSSAAGAQVIAVRKGKGNGFRDLLSRINIVDQAYYVMIDGDNSYLPADLKKFSTLISNKQDDVIMGTRPLLGHTYSNYRELAISLSHVIANLFFAFIGSILYMEPTRDICTGYWVFKGEALKKLRAKLTATNFELEADLFSSAKVLGLKIGNVYISYGKREGKSKIRFTDAYSIIKKLITNRF